MNVPRRAVLSGIAATLVASRLEAQQRGPGVAADAAQAPAAGPIQLRALPAPAKLFTDAAEAADLWGFEGHSGPPVLRVRHGAELRVALRNDLPLPLSLHWHGVRAPNAQDGVGGLTQNPVAPGGTYEYRFAPPDPGTFLIRPIVLGGSSQLSGRGLCGILVVEEREPPAVDAEYSLLVRDWLATPGGTLVPFGSAEEAALAGRLGNRLAVEGSDPPRRIVQPTGTRLRLRLVNGCNARAMRVRFDGLKAYVAAVDGQPTDTFEPLRATLPFGPGSRYDILLDVPEAGARGAVVALLGSGTPLVEVVAGDGAAVARPPVAALQANRLLPPEIKLQNAVRRNIVITGGATRDASGQPRFPEPGRPIWLVNGQPGSATAAPLFTARRGQPVVLGLHNQTGFVQPLHLHGHAMRLLHNLDDGWEPYWLDTLQVAEGKTNQVAFMADNPGRWLLGSAVLERLDAGLWGWFEVT